MKDLALWLGLVSAPALISLILGPPGFEAFRRPDPVAASASVVSEGHTLYAMRCAVCHGRLGEGTERAPGLIAPARGAPAEAMAFHRAVGGGMRPGARDPHLILSPGLTGRQTDGIIAFLRRLERPGKPP